MDIKLISKQSTKTSRGVLSKGWYSIDNNIYLVKGNSNDSVEPLSEYIGSRIAYGLSYGKAVIYSVEKSGLFPDIKASFELVSLCLKWNQANTVQFSKYVDAIEQKEVKDYKVWLLNKATPEMLYDISMLLFIDAIIGNQDRHFNNWDIDIETGNVAPYIDFGASCLAWNRKDWKDIPQRKSITPDISKPFAKAHLQQLKIVESFLKRDKQILKIKNPIEVLEDVMNRGNWISNDYPQYYNAVYYYLSRRIKRICSEFDFIKYV